MGRVALAINGKSFSVSVMHHEYELQGHTYEHYSFDFIALSALLHLVLHFILQLDLFLCCKPLFAHIHISYQYLRYAFLYARQ